MRAVVPACGLLVAMVMMWPPAAPAQQASLQAPTSLQESWQDWQVACVQGESGGRLCAMSQTLVQEEGGRRILALEIVTAPGGETATAKLLLPFGLLLDQGVSLEVDEAAIETNLRFRTCLPGGCVVPIALSAQYLVALRKGETLKVVSAASDTGQAVSFSISLRGFTAAFDRLVELRG